MERLEKEEKGKREGENGKFHQSPPWGHVCIVICHISVFCEVRRQGRRLFSCPLIIKSGNMPQQMSSDAVSKKGHSLHHARVSNTAAHGKGEQRKSLMTFPGQQWSTSPAVCLTWRGKGSHSFPVSLEKTRVCAIHEGWWVAFITLKSLI